MASRQQLPVHPVADLFPMLPDDELKELAFDIKVHGLLHPIVLDAEGVLLDGRNRLKACDLADVKPTFVTYDGDDPVGYAMAVNLARRQLTKGQAAMLAAKSLETSDSGYGDKRRTARAIGVSEARIGYAQVVIKYRPDLVTKVIDGTTGLDDARAKATETKQARADAVRARNEKFDAAVDILAEYGTYPDRAAELRQDYEPLYPNNPVTGARLDLAIDGLVTITKEWLQ